MVALIQSLAGNAMGTPRQPANAGVAMDKFSYKPIWANILSLLVVACVIGCSERNEDAPYDGKVHTRAWIDLNLMGTAVFHGTEVRLEGVLECAKCHDIDQGAGEFVPGCFTCHFGSDGSREPVGSNWIHGRDSHEDYTTEGEVCNTCHELARGFDAGPGICHNCHGSGVEHVLGQPWLDRDSPRFHGDLPQDNCSICHNLSTNCNECHFGPTGRKSPPGSSWPHGRIDNHNDQEDYDNVCDRCHSLSRSYRGDPKLEPDGDCHYCHDH
jgi:hypothetical protein